MILSQKCRIRSWIRIRCRENNADPTKSGITKTGKLRKHSLHCFTILCPDQYRKKNTESSKTINKGRIGIKPGFQISDTVPYLS